MPHKLNTFSLAVLPTLLALFGHGADAQGQEPDPWRIEYYYAAKFLCGDELGDGKTGLVAGTYQTAINISNPSATEEAVFFKRIARALPYQTADEVTVFERGVIGPGESIEVECHEIRHRLTSPMTSQFRTGFLVILAENLLDVSGVYTARDGTSAKIGADVETVEARKLCIPPEEGLVERARLLPSFGPVVEPPERLDGSGNPDGIERLVVEFALPVETASFSSAANIVADSIAPGGERLTPLVLPGFFGNADFSNGGLSVELDVTDSAPSALGASYRTSIDVDGLEMSCNPVFPVAAFGIDPAIFGFRYAYADTAQPALVEVTPSPDELVAPHGGIQIMLDEPLDHFTVQSEVVGAGVEPGLSFFLAHSFDEDSLGNARVRSRPSDGLLVGADYRVRLISAGEAGYNTEKGTQDYSGRVPEDEELVVEFTTGAVRIDTPVFSGVVDGNTLTASGIVVDGIDEVEVTLLDSGGETIASDTAEASTAALIEPHGVAVDIWEATFDVTDLPDGRYRLEVATQSDGTDGVNVNIDRPGISNLSGAVAVLVPVDGQPIALRNIYARPRPNMALPHPLVIPGDFASTQTFTSRVFTTTDGFHVEEVNLTHFTDPVIDAEGAVTGTEATDVTLTPDDEEQAFEFSVEDIELAAGINLFALETTFDSDDGSFTLPTYALVNYDLSPAPAITHLGTGVGPLGAKALVGQRVVITGSGFGDEQVALEAGQAAKGEVVFGADSNGNGGVEAGTVYKWTTAQIHVDVPVGAAETDSGGAFVVVRHADGSTSEPVAFSILPESDDQCDDSFGVERVSDTDLFDPAPLYTKNTELGDLDLDGDLDVFAPSSHPDMWSCGPEVSAADEADRLYVNRGLVGDDPGGLVDERDRYFGTSSGNLGHARNGTYDADFADLNNDGALDIVNIRGPAPGSCIPEEFGGSTEEAGEDRSSEALLECAGMPWVLLSMGRATNSDDPGVDFSFAERSGRFSGLGLPDATDDPGNFPDRIFHEDNRPLLDPTLLGVYDFDDIDIADVDGDGDLDIALAARTERTGNMLLVNQGFAQQGLIGYFQAHEIDASPQGLPAELEAAPPTDDPQDVGHDIGFADIDQDGDQEIIYCNMTDNLEDENLSFSTDPPGLRIYMNESIDGNSIDRSSVSLTDETESRLLNGAGDAPRNISSCRRLEIFDVNGDRFPDIVAGTTRSETLSIYVNQGPNDPGIFHRTTLDIGDTVYGSAHGDFDIDGDLDLAIGNWSRGSCDECWPHLYTNDGGGMFTNVTTSLDFWGLEGGDSDRLGAIDISAGDLDGDGDLDFYLPMGEFNRFEEGQDQRRLFGEDVGSCEGDRRERDQVFLNNLSCTSPALDD